MDPSACHRIKRFLICFGCCWRLACVCVCACVCPTLYLLGGGETSALKGDAYKPKR